MTAGHVRGGVDKGALGIEPGNRLLRQLALECRKDVRRKGQVGRIRDELRDLCDESPGAGRGPARPRAKPVGYSCGGIRRRDMTR